MHAVTNPLAAASTPRTALDAPAGRRVRASRAVTKILATANSRDDDDSQNASTSQPSSSGMLGRRATVAGAAAALFSIARGASSSARNHLLGIVTEGRRDAIAAQVEMRCGPFRLVSLVTREAVDSLGLEPGVLVSAVVKATNVVVELAAPPARSAGEEG